MPANLNKAIIDLIRTIRKLLPPEQRDRVRFIDPDVIQTVRQLCREAGDERLLALSEELSNLVSEQAPAEPEPADEGTPEADDMLHTRVYRGQVMEAPPPAAPRTGQNRSQPKSTRIYRGRVVKDS